jgi:hypothetical protein
MSIYISNEIFLAGLPADGINENNGLILWDSILTPSDFQASGDPGFPARNMWTPDTYQYWLGVGSIAMPANTLSDHVVLSNGGNEIVNCLGIARHNFGTEQYVFVFQESTDGGSNWTDITEPKVVPDDKPILEFFDDTNAGLFRIRLTKFTTLFRQPIIAHVKLGKALVLQRRTFLGHAPATLSKDVSRTQMTSESGQYLGQIITRSFRSGSIDQENNTADYVRENIAPFINHINGHNEQNDTAPATFFYAWRPGDYPDEVVYAWTEDNVKPQNSATYGGGGGLMSWSLRFGAIA